MGINRKLNGADLVAGPLQVRRPRRNTPFEVQVTPRIGIRHCADLPLRFIIAGNRFVSRTPTPKPHPSIPNP
jgi:3-methyladenine DNA glycosylase Mpg